MLRGRKNGMGYSIAFGVSSRRGKICGVCSALAITVVLRNVMISRDLFSVAIELWFFVSIIR